MEKECRKTANDLHNIEVSLSPVLYPSRSLKSAHTAVAVDILRATTAVCAAFSAGCESIIPLTTLEELVPYRAQGFLLAAERGGKKLFDAECGNSPTEYLTMDLHGKRLAYSTTNGTRCMLCATDAERTLIGSFSNISALANTLAATPQDLVIICSGWENDFSLEDTLFAGALIYKLILTGKYQVHNDAATMALHYWNSLPYDCYTYCQQATHVHRLQGMGCEEDIRYAFQMDTTTLVPEVKDGKLVVNIG